MNDFSQTNAFDAYCWAHGLATPEVAKGVGVSSEIVRKWRLPFGDPDFIRPSSRRMCIIYVFTRGKVEPNHWFDLGAILSGAPIPAETVGGEA